METRPVEEGTTVVSENGPGPRVRGRRGPKTPEGRAKVRGNALRHGLTARAPVVPGLERAQDWDVHRAGIVKSLAPCGELESLLAEQVALAAWRLRRVVGYEGAVIAAQVRTAEKEEKRERALPYPDEAQHIIRYEAHLTRQLYHALHELEAFQGRRHGQPAPLARVDVHALGNAEEGIGSYGNRR